jgi:ABC-2 type transport system ATP-binding protein
VIDDGGKVGAGRIRDLPCGRPFEALQPEYVERRVEEAEARLAAAGRLVRDGGSFTVALPADEDESAVPKLVADLVALGVRVHAVEPVRISLEERLLDILRDRDGRR